MPRKKDTKLRNYALDKLKTLYSFVEKGEYSEAMGMFKSSPAGDGYGIDNHCLDCSDVLDEYSDFYDVIEKLRSYAE